MGTTRKAAPRERGPSRFVWLGVITAAVGCQQPPPDEEEEEARPDIERSESLAWVADCAGPGIECATLDMPYDHADPDAGTFPMRIARARRQLDVRSKGTILMNFGGPGADGIDYVPWFSGLLDPLRAEYDLVSWDVRGGGNPDPDGEPLGCDDDLFDDVLDAYDGSTDPAHIEALIAAERAWFASCRETNPELVDHMGTTAWADDMDAIREALELDQISYYGASAGTGLGLTYADRYPERVDRFVLDSTAQAYGGMYSLYQTQLDGISSSVERWAEWCAADEYCAVREDPMGAMIEVMDRAKDDPLGSGTRKLTWGRAAYGIAGNLYSDASWPWLADILYAARDGDASLLLESSDGYFQRYDGAYDTSSKIPWHVWCSDNLVSPTAADIAAWAEADAAAHEAPIAPVGAFDNAFCAAFPPTDPIAAAPTAAGAPPMLMLQGRYDVATPLSGALAAQDLLENGTVMVVWEGSTHVTLPSSECTRDHALAFWSEGTLPADGTVCE